MTIRIVNADGEELFRPNDFSKAEKYLRDIAGMSPVEIEKAFRNARITIPMEDDINDSDASYHT